MLNENPFTTSFGKEPRQFLSRAEEEATIINTFTADHPTQQVFMITGVRGTGKTALLTRIKKDFRNRENWIVVELSPEGDLLASLVEKLCDLPFLRLLFKNANINLSFFGISLGIDSEPPIQSVGTALGRMMTAIKNSDRRLLIAVDEATNTENMRRFASEFQILLREEAPVFLLMTGLFKNIYDLQNEKTMTFLYRAPKIVLQPIEKIAVGNAYKEIFDLPNEQAFQMAENVKGYAFAFQLYGSLCFEAGGNGFSKAVMQKYTAQLGELVYEKLWSELSPKDRKIVTVLAKHGSTAVKTADLIREYNAEYPEDPTPMNSKLMSVYRERLKKEGLVTTENYGNLQLALPRFAEFVNEYGAILL